MADNIFETRYDLEKKSSIKKFYDTYKFLIYSFLFIIIVSFSSYSLYLESKEKKKILLSENYLQAKIYLEAGNKGEAIALLKEVIYADDPTYSALCLFLIMNQNLITNHNELLELFNHLLDNNKFSEDIRNLFIYKKTLLSSNFVNESELLELARPLLDIDNLWRPHALLLLGDFFMSKRENVKAIEFYQEIFSINNLHQDIYNHATSQLAIISNE